jgi:type I restriction enzyme M protein
MTVLRRLDCLLEPSKDKVLELHKRLEEGSFGQNAIAQQLPRVTGYVFYNPHSAGNFRQKIISVTRWTKEL